MSKTHNAGVVTAYGAAVRGGYTGTYEEFCTQQAEYAEHAREMDQAVRDVEDIKTSVESSVSEAEDYANSASAAATRSSESATNASNYAISASQSANSASSSANTAAQSAASAQTSANDAEEAEQSAQGYAQSAERSAESAAGLLANVYTKPEIDSAISKINGSLGTLSAFMNTVPVDTASGAVATFADGADDIPVKNLTVYIEPIQSGTSDPSPDNIRPISGWTGANLTCNNETINIDWTDEAGEVFGGTLNVTTGVLTKTHIFSELPLTGWSASGVNFWHNQSGMSLSTPAKIGYCSHYPCNTNMSGNKVIIFGRAGFSTVPRFVIRDSSFATVSDLEAYLSAQKEAGTPVAVAYPLATPITYQLTPQEVKTILGVNNIYANTGDVSVEYRADIKKYIDKVVATAISALS